MPDLKITGKNFPDPIDPLTRVCLVIEIPDAPEYRAAVMGQLEWLADWRCWRHASDDYVDPPTDNVQVAELFAVAVSEARFEECPEDCMNCEEMIECLQPLFDALQAQITEVAEAVEDVQNTVEDNAAAERPLTQTGVSDEICGGARGVVEAMDSQNMAAYKATEDSWVDKVFEAIPRFISALPIFGELPFDELFQIVDWIFEHQIEDYTAAYDAIKEQMICDLACFVQINHNTFTWDVWNDWLLHLGETYPGDYAAQLFARYAPARQTWVNQIAQLVNKNASLQTYFDTLATAWEGGIQNPEPCVDCDCPTCGVTYEVIEGTLVGDNIITNTTELLVPLVDHSITAYGRPGEVAFALPVKRVTLGWNTGGAADNMYVQQSGETTYVQLDSPSGTMEVVFDTAATNWKIQLGYSGVSTAYDENEAYFHIVDACEE